MAHSSDTPSSQLPNVGFIGLGAMGLCMSTHLVKSSFPVTGFDIFPAALQSFASSSPKAMTAKSPLDVAKNAQVLCLMVATHHHVESALFDRDTGAVHGLPKNSAIIINATVPPAYPASVRRKLDSAEFNRPDIALIDAPVSGGTARAVDGTLTIMASSATRPEIQRKDVQTVLDALSRELSIIPGGLGAGTSVKALNQVMCGIHIVAASEIMGLAAVVGLDTKKYYEYAVSDGPLGSPREGWSWMFENRGERMLVEEPPMSSATAIIVKDVGILMDEEQRLNVSLPLLEAANEVLASVVSKGLAKADDSCIVKVYLDHSEGPADPSEENRKSLVVQRAGVCSTLSASEEALRMDMLCDIHACIHLMSAYETMVFAEALGMTSHEQRNQWFEIISGAAGGSTMFAEVVPKMFEAADYKTGFWEYVQPLVSRRVKAMNYILKLAEGQRYRPTLALMANRFQQKKL